MKNNENIENTGKNLYGETKGHKSISKVIYEVQRGREQCQEKGLEKIAKRLDEVQQRQEDLLIKKEKNPVVVFLLHRRELNRLNEALDSGQVIIVEQIGDASPIPSVPEDTKAVISSDMETSVEKSNKKLNEVQNADIIMMEEDTIKKPKRRNTDKTLLDSESAPEAIKKLEKRYNVYGRAPGKQANKIELENISLTNDQLADILSVSYKQMQMLSKRNLSYISSSLRHRGSYSKALGRVEILLEEKQHELCRSEFEGKYLKIWNNIIESDLESPEGTLHMLVEQAKKSKVEMSKAAEELLVFRNNVAKEFLDDLATKNGLILNDKKNVLEASNQATQNDQDQSEIIKTACELLDRKTKIYENNLKDAEGNFLTSMNLIQQNMETKLNAIASQMKPHELIEKEGYLKELGEIHEKTVNMYAKAIRSGGNLLANYATSGANSAISFGVSRVGAALWTVGV